MQCKVIAKHNTSVSKHAFFFQYTTVIMTIFLINRKAFSKIENGHPLHLLQKKALRIVANQDYIAHSEPICKALNLVKVPDMYQGWGQVQYLYLVLVLKYIFIST